MEWTTCKSHKISVKVVKSYQRTFDIIIMASAQNQVLKGEIIEGDVSYL